MRTPEKKELREAALRFLEVLVDEYTETREQAAQIAAYAVPIVATCLRVFKLGESKEQELSLYPVLQVVELKAHVAGRALQDELFPEDDRSEDDRRRSVPRGGRHVVDLCWGYMCRKASGAHRSTPTVRGLCYQLLGKLALLFPVDVSNEEVYVNKRLFNSATDDLRQQVGRADRQDTANVKEQLGVVAGALTALDGLLSDTDDLRLPEIDVVWSQLLRCLAINVGEIKRFNAPKAALELLGHRIDLFACVEQWTPPPGTASASVEAARLGQSRLSRRRPARTAGRRTAPSRGGGAVAAPLAPRRTTTATSGCSPPRCSASSSAARPPRCATPPSWRPPPTTPSSSALARSTASRGEVRRLAQRPAELDAAELSTLLSAVGELAGPMRRFDGEAEVHTQLGALRARRRCLPARRPPPLRGGAPRRRPRRHLDLGVRRGVRPRAPPRRRRRGRRARAAHPRAARAADLRAVQDDDGGTAAPERRRVAGGARRLDGRDGAQARCSRAVFPALLVTIDGGRSAAHPPPAAFVKGFWTPLLRRHPPPRPPRRGRAAPRDGDLPPAERRERRLREAACGRVLEHVLRAIVRMLHASTSPHSRAPSPTMTTTTTTAPPPARRRPAAAAATVTARRRWRWAPRRRWRTRRTSRSSSR